MLDKVRVLKGIEDMTEDIVKLIECKNILAEKPEEKNTLFIGFGLNRIFMDFFITVENLISMLLKEHKKFKIGMDMKESLIILNKENVINEVIFIFLNEARLLRNRISHRYKEPSREELIEFINNNIQEFSEVINIAKRYL